MYGSMCPLASTLDLQTSRLLAKMRRRAFRGIFELLGRTTTMSSEERAAEAAAQVQC
jgi:hypothetical protein